MGWAPLESTCSVGNLSAHPLWADGWLVRVRHRHSPLSSLGSRIKTDCLSIFTRLPSNVSWWGGHGCPLGVSVFHLSSAWLIFPFSVSAMYYFFLSSIFSISLFSYCILCSPQLFIIFIAWLGFFWNYTHVLLDICYSIYFIYIYPELLLSIAAFILIHRYNLFF